MIRKGFHTRWLIRAFFLSALLFLHVRLSAQLMNLEFDAYNTTHGLSQNFVTSIAQDKTGFIWIGTDDGLNRFDGYEFKVFRNDENDSTSLIDNSIQGTLCRARQLHLDRYQQRCVALSEEGNFHTLPDRFYRLHAPERCIRE